MPPPAPAKTPSAPILIPAFFNPVGTVPTFVNPSPVANLYFNPVVESKSITKSSLSNFKKSPNIP